MKKMLLTLLVITSMLGPVAVTSAQDYKTPYVTDKTVYIYKKVPFSSLQPVSDGKFIDIYIGSKNLSKTLAYSSNSTFLSFPDIIPEVTLPR